MAIDIRATVTCSLGTLISASISDDYVQGTGLIKCRGTCELSGVYTPNIGDEVTFSYTQNGVTTQVPRKLRVLSSFADPFRRTTSVSLGCKLTYLEDLKEPVDWTAYDDPANAALTTEDAKIITLPISASSVMAKCLTELGITASSNPLTNKFSVETFDLGGGYVSVLSDLLVSESYCGYLNTSEVLQVFSLDEEGGTGPVIDSTSLIDLGAINVGQLPGEAVTVSYSTLKLEKPDASSFDGTSPWEREENSTSYAVTIAYISNSKQRTKQYNIQEKSIITTTYTTVKDGEGNSQRVLSKRVEEFETQAAAIAGVLVQQYLENGIAFANLTCSKRTTETYEYGSKGELTARKMFSEGSPGFIVGGAGVDFVLSDTDYVTIYFSNTIPLEAEVQTFEYAGDFQKTTTATYGPWAKTITGQQSIAAARNSFTSSSGVASYLGKLYDASLNVNQTMQGLSLIDYKVETSRKTEAYKSPAPSDFTNSKYAKGGDPNNGWRTNSTADLELALGSATAQRRIEFSIPYAPDDTFTRSGSYYSSVASDADEKAKRYGRSQNRLLLGNRSGMNLQLSAGLMPDAPFAPLVVDANGLAALYRTNGTSWQMDPSGILASTDALFWGAVGTTSGTYGSFWFPVAPGITELPMAPAEVAGEMTVTSVTPVWNETLVMEARTSTKLEVTSLSYALTLLTEVAAVSKTKLVMRKITKVEVPSAEVGLSSVTPVVSAGASVKPPASELVMASQAPSLNVGNVSVTSPLAVVEVLGGSAEVSATLTAVKMPSATVTTAAVNPTIYTESDPYFANVSLLLRFEGSNGSTTYTDSSNNAFSPSNVYGTAAITTSLYRFGAGGGDFNVPYSGTQSGTWTGTKNIVYSYSAGSALDLSAGAEFNGNEAALASSWTVEFWFYLPAASTNTPLTQGLMNIGNTVHRGYGIVVYLQQSGTTYYPAVQYGNKFQSSTYRRYTGQATSAAASVGWNHFAITYQLNTSDPFSSRLRLFINGYLAQDPNPVNGGGYGANYLYFSENKLLMGGCNVASEGTASNPGNKSQLTWDELRITKGIVRYAPDNYSQLTLGSSYFTPPTSRFPVA